MIAMALFLLSGAISYGATNDAATDTTGSCFANFYDVAQNGTVYFVDTSVVTSPVTARTWDFGDGTSSTIKNPTHTYASGVYSANVCLHVRTATDSCTQCRLVTVRTADTCVADFSYAKVPGSAGYTYNFYDQSQGSGLVSSRLWTLPGGISKTDTSFTFTFDTTFMQANVCLAIQTSTGCKASVCKTIVLKDTVVNKCTAVFYAFAQNGTVSFLDSSKADTYITAWNWNFGDGTSSNLKNPVHTYASNIYNADVCLTIASTTGCMSTLCKYIHVRDSASTGCIANFAYTAQNRTVTFTDNLSADTVIYRVWNFGDGTYGNGRNPTHTYAGSNQYYNVCLTIQTKTDSCTYCKYIYVPSSGDSCQAQFNYTSVSDSAGMYTTYRFTDISQNSGGTAWRRWALSDSTQSTDSVFVHTFDNRLTSTSVCLTIGTNSGCQATTCKTITGNDTVPAGCTANFTYNVSNHSVSFTDNSSASNSIVAWLWDFGDSTSSTVKNPVHIFSSNLSMANVCLKISSAMGCQSSVCKTILLTDSVPAVTCKAAFGYSRDSLSTGGNTYHFYNYSTSQDPLTFVWNFGDGTYSTLANPTHTFNTTSGHQFLVGLFINSAKGCLDSTYQWLTIPGDSLEHTIAGVVEGNNKLLINGTILLYKKGTRNYTLKGYQVLSGGAFRFEQLEQGSYILYAIPGMMYLSSYLPTYYVNKLSWTQADIIHLTGSALGLTLQLQPTRFINKGIGKIKGTLTNTQGTDSMTNAVTKSGAAVSPSVFLYSQSGAALCSSVPDADGNFEFQDLPMGNYVVKIEYPNLEDNSRNVSLSNEVPEKDNLNFTITDNVTGVNTLADGQDVEILYLSSGDIAIRIKESGTYNISLTNMSGAVMINTEMTLNANTDNVLPTGNLARGIYILTLQNKTGVTMKKIFR